MSVPRITGAGGLYTLVWDDEEICIRVDRITENSKHEVQAEIKIEQTSPEALAHLHQARFNFTSTATRKTLASHLTSRREDVDWHALLEQMVVKVLQAHREGEPVVQLAEHSASDALKHRINPVLQEKQATVLFGDGGSGKSFLSLYWAILVASGTPAGRFHPEPGNVLLLDYETDVDTHWSRVNQLTAGLNMAIPDGLYYRYCYQTIPADIEQIQREVFTKDIRLVIIDSAAPAVGEPESAQMTSDYFKALRTLKCTTLTIAHVSKMGKEHEVYGCYADDTEVLTPDGWRLHRDMHANDAVMAFDPNLDCIYWDYVQYVHEYDYQGAMYQFGARHRNGSSLSLMVTPNHRMVVKPGYKLPVGTKAPYRNPQCWHIKQADELGKGEWIIPQAACYSGDRCAASRYSEEMARFIGWWVCDGSLSGDGPQITQAEGPLLDRMKETIAALGYEYSQWQINRPNEKPCFSLRLKNAVTLGRWLRQRCGEGAPNKHIPHDLIMDNPTNRQALFDAIMETDGGRYKNCWSFSSSSKQLADDVQMIATLLGYASSMNCRKPAKPHHLDRYVVRVRDTKQAWIKPRNTAMQQYDGKVYCLTVPTGAYLVRHNGKVSISGNSSFWRNLPRSNFRILSSHKPGDDHFVIGLRHTKSNNGKILPTMGFEVAFADQAVTINETKLINLGEAASIAPLHERVREVLSRGVMEVEEIAEAIDENQGPVQKILNAYDKRLWQRVGTGWGLR